jgi:hypothetical protein
MAVQIFYNNDKPGLHKRQQNWKYIPGYDPEASNPIHPVFPAPPRLNARSSAFFRSPISCVDQRMLYYENRRPKLAPLSTEEIEAIKMELQHYTLKKKRTRQRSGSRASAQDQTLSARNKNFEGDRHLGNSQWLPCVFQ